MSERWRRKTYYKPRVLIDTARVLNPQYADSLLCITGPQLEMLRNLTQYLHRRSTFVSAYDTEGYLAPTNEEWDDIQDIVAELEETLMGCEDFLTLMEQLLVQMTCVCSQVSAQERLGPVMEPMVEEYLTGGEMQFVDDYGGDTVIDTKRCATAQLVWQLCYELMTEVIQPLQESTVDILLPVAMVLLVTWIGTPVLGIPAGVFVGLIWNIIEAWVEGSLESVRNTIISYQHELVCAVYNGLATDYRAAEAEAVLVIADMAGLSPIDKIVVHTLFAPWAIALAALAWNNQTAWATSNVESGYCADCDIIEGVDWWALRLEPSTNTITLDNTGNAHWEDGCWQGNVPDGEVCCGLIFRVQNQVGDCTLKAMSGPDAGCTGASLWDNTSAHLPNDMYFGVNGEQIDEESCKERLAPDAEDSPPTNAVNRITGPTGVNAGFQLGWSCVGYAEVVAIWQIFEGEAP